MKRLLLLAGLAAGMTLPEGTALAQERDRGPLGFGLLRRRQAKPDPAARARQLIAAVQTDPDEDKRRGAAEELRGLDPRAFPDIIPALVGAIQRDPSTGVRTAAVETIGRLKPVNQSAGLALEAALVSDPDAKVQTAIRSALWQYHLNGYRTVAGTPLTSQTAEPPLAGPRPTTSTSAKPTSISDGSAGPVQFRPIAMGPGKGSAYVPTPEPPLARPRPVSTPTPTPAAPASLPVVVPAPVTAPALPTPPVATPTTPPPSVMPRPMPAAPTTTPPALPTPPAVGPDTTIPVPLIPVAPVPPAPGSPPKNF